MSNYYEYRPLPVAIQKMNDKKFVASLKKKPKKRKRRKSAKQKRKKQSVQTTKTN